MLLHSFMVNQRGSMFLLVNTVTSRNSKDLTPLNCASFSNFITQHYLSFEISFGIIQGTNYLLSIYPSLYPSINYLSVMNGVTSQSYFHIYVYKRHWKPNVPTVQIK